MQITAFYKTANKFRLTVAHQFSNYEILSTLNLLVFKFYLSGFFPSVSFYVQNYLCSFDNVQYYTRLLKQIQSSKSDVKNCLVNILIKSLYHKYLLLL